MRDVSAPTISPIRIFIPESLIMAPLDGNCLFRALSDQLYGSQSKHAELRREICDFIEVHKDDYAGFVEDPRGFDIHLKCMRQSGTSTLPTHGSVSPFRLHPLAACVTPHPHPLPMWLVGWSRAHLWGIRFTLDCRNHGFFLIRDRVQTDLSILQVPTAATSNYQRSLDCTAETSRSSSPTWYL